MYGKIYELHCQSMWQTTFEIKRSLNSLHPTSSRRCYAVSCCDWESCAASCSTGISLPPPCASTSSTSSAFFPEGLALSPGEGFGPGDASAAAQAQWGTVDANALFSRLPGLQPLRPTLHHSSSQMKAASEWLAAGCKRSLH